MRHSNDKTTQHLDGRGEGGAPEVHRGVQERPEPHRLGPGARVHATPNKNSIESILYKLPQSGSWHREHHEQAPD